MSVLKFEISLKPCPFCGGEAYFDMKPCEEGYRTFVRCVVCGTSTREMTVGSEYGCMVAVEMWQTRKGNERECDE